MPIGASVYKIKMCRMKGKVLAINKVSHGRCNNNSMPDSCGQFSNEIFTKYPVYNGVAVFSALGKCG